MKFNNEDDLLKFLIKHMDTEKRCYDKQLNIQQYIDVNTMSEYLKTLKENGFISVYMGGVIEVHDKGISHIKDKKYVNKVASPIIKWIFGIVTAIITAYLIFQLGLN